MKLNLVGSCTQAPSRAIHAVEPEVHFCVAVAVAILRDGMGPPEGDAVGLDVGRLVGAEVGLPVGVVDVGVASGCLAQQWDDL